MNAVVRHVSLSVSLSILLWSPAVAAQETPQQTPTSEGLTPVVIVTRAEIEASGKLLLSDVLQRLPEQIGGSTLQGDTGNGATRLNLRGLGSDKTLVLLNGRRFAFGGPGGDGAVDLTAIPAAIVERVEVWKQGGSTRFGSDAFAGVINVVTREDFKGAEVTALGGTSPRLDGTTYDVRGAGGVSGALGNAFLSVGYAGRQPVSNAAREFSAYSWIYDFPTRRLFPSGSSATPNGRIGVNRSATGNAAWQDLRARFPTASGFTFDPATGQWRPFDMTRLTEAGGDLYNFHADREMVMPFRRFDAFASGAVNLGPSVSAFAEALYVNREASQNKGGLPFFTITEGFTVAPDNAYNPFGVPFTDVRRRFVEFGDQVYRQETDTFRVVGGVRGAFDLGNRWDWNVALNYGRTNGIEALPAQIHRERFRNAVGPSFVDDGGVLRCGTPLAPIEGCVPLNLFGGAGSITPEMRDAVTLELTNRGFDQQIVAEARIGGALFRLPTASAQSVVGLGVEHRREAGEFAPDAAQGETSSFSGSPHSGSYDSTDAWFELWAPILRRLGDGATGDLLGAKLAARVARYNAPDSGPLGPGVSRMQFNYELGGRISPVPDVAVRGSWARAYREPRLIELFMSGFDTFPNATDPCSADFPGGIREQGTTTDRQCDLQGVPDNHFDDRIGFPAIVRGNPLLSPESGDVFTVGVGFQPRWVSSLSLAIDYFDVTVRDTITHSDPQQILDDCYRSGNEARCANITRTPESLISRIDAPLTNAGRERTSGIDIGLEWKPSTAWGAFAFRGGATYLSRFEVEFPGADLVDFRNTFDWSAALPEWRATASVRWALEGLSADAFVRYVGGYRECDFGGCIDPDPEAPAPLFRTIGPYATVDLSLAYALAWGPRSTTTLRAGVANLFDRAPPLLVTGPEAGSDAFTYDYMGRFFFLSASHAFK